MANFSTHLQASVITSAALCSVVLATSIASTTDTLTIFIIGSLAGLLPDLDADNSKSLNSLFSIFALCGAISLPRLIEFESLIGIWLGAISVYVGVMYLLKPLFEKFTIHRGASHSLLNVLMCALLAANLALIAGRTIQFALLVSLSVTLGMLIHLTLDECYSVDINNNELKASFGTALKPLSLNSPLASLIQVCIVAASLYMLSPYQESIMRTLTHWYLKLTHLPLLPDVLVL